MISICPITKAVHFDHFIKVAGFASLLHSKIIPFVINKYSVGGELLWDYVNIPLLINFHPLILASIDVSC